MPCHALPACTYGLGLRMPPMAWGRYSTAPRRAACDFEPPVHACLLLAPAGCLVFLARSATCGLQYRPLKIQFGVCGSACSASAVSGWCMLTDSSVCALDGVCDGGCVERCRMVNEQAMLPAQHTLSPCQACHALCNSAGSRLPADVRSLAWPGPTHPPLACLIQPACLPACATSSDGQGGRDSPAWQGGGGSSGRQAGPCGSKLSAVCHCTCPHTHLQQ